MMAIKNRYPSGLALLLSLSIAMPMGAQESEPVQAESRAEGQEIQTETAYTEAEAAADEDSNAKESSEQVVLERADEAERAVEQGVGAVPEEIVAEEVMEEEEPAKALPTPELTSAEHESLAKKALEVGDFGSAAAHWQSAITADPANLRVGAEYRQAVIAAHEDGKKDVYEDCIEFFERLVEAFPNAASARLNLGYAYVDKIPVEGAITAVILANKALGEFSAALEVEESWLGYYTRGNSYMYWPAIFGRTELGIADLEKALELAENLPKQPHHGRAWAALGDGYWRLDDRDKMRQIWQDGLGHYPGTVELEQRLALEGEELDQWLEAHFETSARVGTHLRELFESGEMQ